MCLAKYQLATILFHGLFKKYVTFCGGRREGLYDKRTSRDAGKLKKQTVTLQR